MSPRTHQHYLQLEDLVAYEKLLYTYPEMTSMSPGGSKASAGAGVSPCNFDTCIGNHSLLQGWRGSTWAAPVPSLVLSTLSQGPASSAVAHVKHQTRPWILPQLL